MIFVYSNLFTSGLISTWRVTERFFAEYFDFLFDNISWCYLVFASLFPALYDLHLLLIMLAYGLRVVLPVYCECSTFVLHLDKLE